MDPVAPNPLHFSVPQHINSLLERLHRESRIQEDAISAEDHKSNDFHDLMRDKFIALDQDKSQFVYQICRAINAKTVVEAGTSYGVSTIYLALAVSQNASETGGTGKVIATEYEPEKAKKAREHWNQCGKIVSEVIDLREGDLRETLKKDIQNVDLLLLDIWADMALPTLKVLQPKMHRGTIILADNTAKYNNAYGELLAYLRAPDSGFSNLTLPYSHGLEMCVYLPKQQ